MLPSLGKNRCVHLSSRRRQTRYFEPYPDSASVQWDGRHPESVHIHVPNTRSRCTHTHLSPHPTRNTTRAAGSGDGAHLVVLGTTTTYYCICKGGPVLCGSHDGLPGAGDVASRFPCWLLRRTLAFNSPPSFVVWCYCTTAPLALL